MSIFDGYSSAMIALKKNGIEPENYFSSEVDEYAKKVSSANFPEIKQIGAVENIDTRKLPNIDILAGGSPCQGFSYAGKQLNFNDPRSALFFEFVRILKKVKPRYFLLENVKMKHEYQDIITEHLGVRPIEINSALVSAQNRSRLYWTNIPNISQPVDKGLTIKDVVKSDRDCCFSSAGRDTNKIRRLRAKTLKSSCLTARYYKGVKSDGAPFIYFGDKEKGSVFDYSEKSDYRMLTPIECELLQTVPKNYTNHVSNTQRYKMLGNGWTVDVIAHIFKNLET